MPLNGREWGIFDDNDQPLIEADTVLGVEVAADSHISNYPQQDGAFASYNKIQAPTELKLIYGIAGTTQDRYEMITALDFAKRRLKTYTLSMPEYFYPSVNVIHYGFRRNGKQGPQLIQIEVWLEEVRILGRQYVSFGRSVNTNDTKSQGNVQASQTVTLPQPSSNISSPTPSVENQTTFGTSLPGILQNNSNLTNPSPLSTSNLSTFTPQIGTAGFTAAPIEEEPNVPEINSPASGIVIPLDEGPDVDIWFSVPEPK